MAKKNKIEATGTAGAGTAWSHPLTTETEDGARIVYVAVPNEDSIRLTQEFHERKAEQEPRTNALTTIIGLRQFGMSDKSVDDILREAAKVEAYIRNGTVPEATSAEGPAEVEDND